MREKAGTVMLLTVYLELHIKTEITEVSPKGEYSGKVKFQHQ